MHKFLVFMLGIKLYMFLTVPLSVARSFSLYTQQWYMSYRFADRLLARKLSANLYDIYNCCVSSEKLLTTDRGTVRNMSSFIQKKKTSSVYDCTVEDVEYICNSNSTLCLFYFAIFVVLLLS